MDAICWELRDRKSYIDLIWGMRGIVMGPISMFLIVQSNMPKHDPEREVSLWVLGLFALVFPAAALAAGVIGLSRPVVIGYIDAKRLRAGGRAVSRFARMVARDLVCASRGLFTFRPW